MITVVVETQKVYSHSNDGMPKVEVLSQKLRDGANFDKFLKYLPFQGFIRDKVKILKVVEKKDGKISEIDKTPWVERVKEVVNKMNQPKETIYDKYEKEKQRNDELSDRLAALEAKIGNSGKEPKEETKDSNFESLTKTELVELYKEKFDKNPFHGWKKEELIEKLM